MKKTLMGNYDNFSDVFGIFIDESDSDSDSRGSFIKEDKTNTVH